MVLKKFNNIHDCASFLLSSDFCTSDKILAVLTPSHTANVKPHIVLNIQRAEDLIGCISVYDSGSLLFDFLSFICDRFVNVRIL
jgi:hypothetical protein